MPRLVGGWTHVLIGESAIDFDMTLKTVMRRRDGVLVVRHVPPEKSAVKLPTAWMQTPVGNAPNNWWACRRNRTDATRRRWVRRTLTWRSR